MGIKFSFGLGSKLNFFGISSVHYVSYEMPLAGTEVVLRCQLEIDGN